MSTNELTGGLIITVKGANNLPKPFFGNINPSCEVCVTDSSNVVLRNFSTGICINNFSPIWDETFGVILNRKIQPKVTFRVKNHEDKKNNPSEIGNLEVPFLGNISKTFNLISSATLDITITFHPIKVPHPQFENRYFPQKFIWEARDGLTWVTIPGQVLEILYLSQQSENELNQLVSVSQYIKNFSLELDSKEPIFINFSQMVLYGTRIYDLRRIIRPKNGFEYVTISENNEFTKIPFTRPLWEYFDVSDQWVPYSDELQKTIEDKYQEGNDEVEYTREKYLYRLSLENFSQTNMLSGKSRNARRVAHQGSTPLSIRVHSAKLEWNNKGITPSFLCKIIIGQQEVTSEVSSPSFEPVWDTAKLETILVNDDFLIIELYCMMSQPIYLGAFQFPLNNSTMSNYKKEVVPLDPSPEMGPDFKASIVITTEIIGETELNKQFQEKSKSPDSTIAQKYTEITKPITEQHNQMKKNLSEYMIYFANGSMNLEKWKNLENFLKDLYFSVCFQQEKGEFWLFDSLGYVIYKLKSPIHVKEYQTLPEILSIVLRCLLSLKNHVELTTESPIQLLFECIQFLDSTKELSLFFDVITNVSKQNGQNILLGIRHMLLVNQEIFVQMLDELLDKEKLDPDKKEFKKKFMSFLVQSLYLTETPEDREIILKDFFENGLTYQFLKEVEKNFSDDVDIGIEITETVIEFLQTSGLTENGLPENSNTSEEDEEESNEDIPVIEIFSIDTPPVTLPKEETIEIFSVEKIPPPEKLRNEEILPSPLKGKPPSHDAEIKVPKIGDNTPAPQDKLRNEEIPPSPLKEKIPSHDAEIKEPKIGDNTPAPQEKLRNEEILPSPLKEKPPSHDAEIKEPKIRDNTPAPQEKLCNEEIPPSPLKENDAEIKEPKIKDNTSTTPEEAQPNPRRNTIVRHLSRILIKPPIPSSPGMPKPPGSPLATGSIPPPPPLSTGSIPKPPLASIPPPPLATGSSAPAPKVAFVPFSIESLQSVENTIFQDIKAKDLKEGYKNRLSTSFSKTTKVESKIVPQQQAPQPESSSLILLERGRQMELDFFLKKYKFNFENLENCIIECDKGNLPDDIYSQLLTKFTVTPKTQERASEEKRQCEEYLKREFDSKIECTKCIPSSSDQCEKCINDSIFKAAKKNLTKPQELLILLWKIPDLCQLLKLIQIQVDLDGVLENARPKSTIVLNFLNDLQGEALKTVLSTSLAFFQYLGKRVGGFKFSSLTKLKTITSPNNKNRTLLVELVQLLRTEHPNIFPDWFDKITPQIKSAAEAFVSFVGTFPELYGYSSTIEEAIEHFQGKTRENLLQFRKTLDLKIQDQEDTRMKISDVIDYLGADAGDIAPEEKNVIKISSVWKKLEIDPELDVMKDRIQRDKRDYTFLVSVMNFLEDVKKVKEEIEEQEKQQRIQERKKLNQSRKATSREMNRIVLGSTIPLIASPISEEEVLQLPLTREATKRATQTTTRQVTRLHTKGQRPIQQLRTPTLLNRMHTGFRGQQIQSQQQKPPQARQQQQQQLQPVTDRKQTATLLKTQATWRKK